MSFATPARTLRSAAFRLALVYMALFGASVALLLAFLWQATVGALTDQIDEVIRADIGRISEQFDRGGARGVAEILRARARRDPGGRAVYLLADPLGNPLAGNLSSWPGAPPDADGWVSFELSGRGAATQPARARAFMLPGGLRLLVGRDVRELARFQQRISGAMIWGTAITLALALAGGFAMSRSTTRRIEAINETSREIVTGDLTRRVPVRGSGDDFDRLAVNLNDMLDRIQALMEGLRHMSDGIAHDLRTPLARLRGRLEDIGDDGLPDAERRRRTADAIADADGLIAMFNGLLRIARIEAGARGDGFAPVDLGAVVRDVAELYEPLAQEKGLAFRADGADAETFSGDRDLVFQAVANLVDNAIKYTPAGGSVAVAARGRGLEVRDTGPGIPEDRREEVFERFRRLDGARGAAGSGLGLSLVRAVADLHGGAVALADATPGLRATLSFGRSRGAAAGRGGACYDGPTSPAARHAPWSAA